MGNKNDSGTSVHSQQQTQGGSQRASQSSATDDIDRRSMTYEQLAERRSTPRSKTPFYKVMLGLNVFGWVGMVVVLILFHYARPDFISGVQQYWGIEGDSSWSEGHLSAMTIMLQVCLIVSLVSIVMRARRNRRRTDSFGVNLIILFAIAAISLITLATTLGLQQRTVIKLETEVTAGKTKKLGTHVSRAAKLLVVSYKFLLTLHNSAA